MRTSTSSQGGKNVDIEFDSYLPESIERLPSFLVKNSYNIGALVTFQFSALTTKLVISASPCYGQTLNVPPYGVTGTQRFCVCSHIIAFYGVQQIYGVKVYLVPSLRPSLDTTNCFLSLPFGRYLSSISGLTNHSIKIFPSGTLPILSCQKFF